MTDADINFYFDPLRPFELRAETDEALAPTGKDVGDDPVISRPGDVSHLRQIRPT